MPFGLPLAMATAVLVTGANGFIAAHVVAQLLDRGYNVIGSVRGSKKRDLVLRTHSFNPNLSVIEVEDITKSEGYLTALQADGSKVDAIVHLAAPFSYSVSDFEKDLMIPAVAGSRAVLEAAEALGVRRVIHTNSFACIYDAALGPRPGYTYTEKDWSPLSYEDGKNAPNAPTAYRASKAVAETAAFDFMREKSRSFDLVSMCPAMVFGPYVNQDATPASIQELGESVKIVWDVISAGKDAAVPPTKGPIWVDVRDVAKAHVVALKSTVAAGQRYMLAAGVYCNQEIADEVRELGLGQQSVPQGNPGVRDADKHFGVDGTKVLKELDLTYTSLQRSLGDLAPQLFSLAEKNASAVL